MDLMLAGKRVLITGSTSGIGKAIAECMLEENAQVIINGRNKEKLGNTLTELHKQFPQACIDGFACNATQIDGIKNLKEFVINKWGKIDILIPSVGRGKAFSQDPLSRENWDSLMQINLLGIVDLMKEFDEILENGASIITISSIAGKEVIGAPIAYAAAKQSIIVFIKYMSKRLAARNIRINAVMPGNVFFQGGRWEEILNDDYEKTMEYINTEVPLKRFATPEEIADAVVFLASPKSAFTTGAVLTIDGGQTNSVG